MSKLIAFTYSFLILIQSFNINLEDFSKFSVLLKHAEFHKEKYGDTFFEFLSEHYGDSKVNHEDDHEEHPPLLRGRRRALRQPRQLRQRRQHRRLPQGRRRDDGPGCRLIRVDRED